MASGSTDRLHDGWLGRSLSLLVKQVYRVQAPISRTSVVRVPRASPTTSVRAEMPVCRD